jgi:hypothetical protein
MGLPYILQQEETGVPTMYELKMMGRIRNNVVSFRFTIRIDS